MKALRPVPHEPILMPLQTCIRYSCDYDVHYLQPPSWMNPEEEEEEEEEEKQRKAKTMLKSTIQCMAAFHAPPTTLGDN